MKEKKPSVLLINGLFLTERVNGVQRFGNEILRCLDQIVCPGSFEILVPQYADDIDKHRYKNIEIVKYGRLKGKLWEQVDYPIYAKMHRQQGIHFTNVIPLLHRKGTVVLHDVIFKAHPDFFNSSIRGNISIFWRRFNYLAVKHSKMDIVTVSHFSKKEIEKYYKIKPERIKVVYNSWEHMTRVKADETVFERNNLVPGSYYFSMATLAKNKNFKWILRCAERSPNEQFVIAGGGDFKKIEREETSEALDNILYLGYVTDEEAKALMQECKGFLFPTLYEGFGIPPLEAVASGARRIIVSDTPCMREIYKSYALFIDPNNAESFDTVIDKDPDGCERELLNDYSWEKSANNLLASIVNQNK